MTKTCDEGPIFLPVEEFSVEDIECCPSVSLGGDGGLVVVHEDVILVDAVNLRPFERQNRGGESLPLRSCQGTNLFPYAWSIWDVLSPCTAQGIEPFALRLGRFEGTGAIEPRLHEFAHLGC